MMSKESTYFPAPTKESDEQQPFPSVGSADVAVFWDFENVRIPAWCPTSTASEGIRKRVAKYGRIVEKRLYYDSRQQSEYRAPRSELDQCGFTLVDCPSRSRKETLDKKLIVDVLCFAWERASRGATACVVLITSDGDYSYAIARLRDIGVFTVVMYRPDVVAKILIDNANVVMSWEFDVLGGPPENDEDEGDESIGVAENITPSPPALLEATTVATTSTETGVTESSTSSPVISESLTELQESVPVKQPNVQTRGKFALFCTVVLNIQHRRVKEGISVYQSWAVEAFVASSFYEKVGEKDREAYIKLRTMASEKGFIEFGRRNLKAPNKPVVKVSNRIERAEGLSLDTYLRLTYSGLSVFDTLAAEKENDWTMVLPKNSKRESRGDIEIGAPLASSGTDSSSKPDHGGVVFVGGLAWQTTEDSLRSYFCQFGKLHKVLVLEGRGYGFVFFRKKIDAETVLSTSAQHRIDQKLVDVKPYKK